MHCSLNKRKIGFYLALFILACSLPVIVGCGNHTSSPSPANDKFFGAILPSEASVNAAPAGLLFGTGSSSSSVTLTSNAALPPIGRQGRVNSCVAWACGYGLASWETAKASGGDSTTPDHQASAADHYWKILRAMGG